MPCLAHRPPWWLCTSPDRAASESLFARGNRKHQRAIFEKLGELDVLDCATPDEVEFLKGAKTLDDQTTTNAWWMLDAVPPLLWALGADIELGFPRDGLKLALVESFMPPPTQIDEVYPGLRAIGEILDQTDLTYRLHWASKTEKSGAQRCEWLCHSALMERHKAFNWLVGYRGYETWDEVTADT